MPDSEPLLVTPAFANVPSIIKIIGVGGGGGNAVGQMYRDNIPEVRYMVCNTDHKALENSPVPNRLQLGPGLGAGGDPRKGRELAEENVTAIENALDPQTRMLFITAGMGGGTGTELRPSSPARPASATSSPSASSPSPSCGNANGKSTKHSTDSTN